MGTILGFLLPVMLGAVAQPPSLPEDHSSDLYNVAFVAFLEARAENYAKVAKDRDYFNVRVQRDDPLTEFLPRQTGPFRIEYLDPEAIKKQWSQRKKAILIVVVRPIRNEGDSLIAGFSEYWVSLRKGRFVMALEGGGNVRLRHDCETHRFVVEKVDLWGV
jgi:hypothetical protein